MAEEAELADELFGTPARASTQAVATRSGSAISNPAMIDWLTHLTFQAAHH